MSVNIKLTVPEGRSGTSATLPTPNKCRHEPNLIATFSGSNNGVSTAVSFVVECKRSARHPWVMFAAPGNASDMPLQTRIYHSRWVPRIDAVATTWVPTRTCIDLTGQIAYGGAPVFGDQTDKGESRSTRDVVFAAIMSAYKAAYAFAKARSEKEKATVHIAFPAIVVDTQLFSCTLPDFGDDIEIKPIPSGIPLRWARPLGGRQLTVVDVVGAHDLTQYVQQSAGLAWSLANTLSQAGLPG